MIRKLQAAGYSGVARVLPAALLFLVLSLGAVRRFVSLVHTVEDLEETVKALDAVVRALAH